MRDLVSGQWVETTVIITDVEGRAILFEALAKKQQVEHRDSDRVPLDLDLTKAVPRWSYRQVQLLRAEPAFYAELTKGSSNPSAA